MPTKPKRLRQTMSDPLPTVDERTVDVVLNSVRQAANVLCDRWSLLILVLAHAGVSRYQAFSLRGGMASRMLTTRLLLLDEHGVIVRVAYTRHPPRYDYFLSHMGLALFDVFATMARWESSWHFDGPGTSLVIEHSGLPPLW